MPKDKNICSIGTRKIKSWQSLIGTKTSTSLSSLTEAFLSAAMIIKYPNPLSFRLNKEGIIPKEYLSMTKFLVFEANFSEKRNKLLNGKEVTVNTRVVESTARKAIWRSRKRGYGGKAVLQLACWRHRKFFWPYVAVVPVWKTSMEWNSLDFHGKFSMEFHRGLRHQFPRNSMENFSIDFHGKYLHEGLGHFPWNSMENIRAPISMEFHGNFCIDIFHGGLGHFLWNSMEKFHAIP